MTKDTGDEVSVSVKVNHGNFTLKDKLKLEDDIKRRLEPYSEDALYFKVRYNEKVGKSKGITESVKVSTLEELSIEVNRLFLNKGVSDNEE